MIVTRKDTILILIGCPQLDLIKVNSINGTGGYWYFEFDTGNKYETESVMVPKLKDMSIDAWVAIGKEFVNKHLTP